MSLREKIKKYLGIALKFGLKHWLNILSVFSFAIIAAIATLINNYNSELADKFILPSIGFLLLSCFAIGRLIFKLLKNIRLIYLWPALFILFYVISRALTTVWRSNLFWSFFYLHVLLILFFIFVISIASRLRRRRLKYWFRVLNVPHLLKVAGVILIVFSIYSLYQQNQELRQELSLIEERLGGVQKLTCSIKTAVEDTRRSTVRIVGGEAEGSGFAIQEPGWIVTNFHVIEYEPWPMIILPNNKKVRGEVIMANKNVDLAVIKIKDLSLPRLTWGMSELVEPTQEIMSLGFPFGGDLPGEATVTKGYLSGRRFNNNDRVQYLQMDNTFNPGVSGGPMIDICGEVIGVNIAGGSGFGLSISSSTAKKTIIDLSMAANPTKDIHRYNINPQKGPVQTVRAFYHYLRIGKMQKAYDLVSKNMMKEASFADWKKGYNKNLSTSVVSAKLVPNEKNIVKVKLTTKDFVNNEIIYSYFEGTWEVREENGKLMLYEANIAEIDPDWLWFYDFDDWE